MRGVGGGEAERSTHRKTSVAAAPELALPDAYRATGQYLEATNATSAAPSEAIHRPGYCGLPEICE